MGSAISASANPSQTAFSASVNDYSPRESRITSNRSPLQQQSDRVTLSQDSTADKRRSSAEFSENKLNTESSAADNKSKLSSEELREIQKLQKRDAEVRAHEQAHLSTAGQYTEGGASYSYKTGPNGKRYITEGEVPIDLSKEKDPKATLKKMSQIRRAALAPANPSAADRNIAAQASMISAQALQELNSSAGEKITSRDSTQADSKDESNSQSKESPPSTDDHASLNPRSTPPSYTRQMVMQAYAAQS